MAGTPPVAADSEAIGKRIAAVDERARAQGVHFLTFRRLAEAVGLGPGEYERFRAQVIDRWPQRQVAGLWSVAPSPAVPEQGRRLVDGTGSGSSTVCGRHVP